MPICAIGIWRKRSKDDAIGNGNQVMLGYAHNPQQTGMILSLSAALKNCQTTEEQPKRGRGRPRKHETRSQRQREYEARSGYEQSEARKAYKREWAKKNRAKKKAES